jgi:hypothetical protein
VLRIADARHSTATKNVKSDSQASLLPVVDGSAWADVAAERHRIEQWWSARTIEFERHVRQWREERSRRLAEIHRAHLLVQAEKDALTARQREFAREVARERADLYRERDAVDRRRSWADLREEQFDVLQASVLEGRYLAKHRAGEEIAPLLRHLTDYQRRWKDFRGVVLRERLELVCERERFRIREQESRVLRRIVFKQRALLAGFFAEQRLAERLWEVERQHGRRTIEELETSLQKLTVGLLNDSDAMPYAEARVRFAA